MSFQFQVESSMVTVKLENKRHIKHCYLRIIDKNLIQIRANIFFTINDAKKLVEKKKDWIIKQLEGFENNTLKDDEFLYFGKIQKLDSHNIKNLDKFYKEQIKEYIPYLVEKHSKNMNLYPNEIKYRKNKRTWGSCNHKNDLSFNTLLVKFPIEVMEYVVIHELAHIKHKNHSKKFWDLVEMFCPDYKQREALLKSFL